MKKKREKSYGRLRKRCGDDGVYEYVDGTKTGKEGKNEEEETRTIKRKRKRKINMK